MSDSDSSIKAPRVRSIVAASRILSLLANEGVPLGVNAIARRLSLSPSSCFNILKTLAAEGFVDFDTEKKSYQLGVTPVFLARRVLNTEQTLRVASPYLDAMAKDYRCVSGLWKLVPNDRLMLLGLFDSRSLINIHIEVGQRLPHLVGAMGRCVAAHSNYDPKDLKAEFGALTWQKPLNFETYLAEIEKARELNWAKDVDNFAEGVTTIASPILDRQGRVRYCISNVLFSGQAETGRIDEIGNRLREVAKLIAKEVYDRP